MFKHQGVALIVALFFISLLAAISILLIETFRMNVHRAILLQNVTTAKFDARGALLWAMEQLNEDYRKKMDLTPITAPVSKGAHTEISAVIFNAEGRFNLNDLIIPSYQKSFALLMQSLFPQMNTDEIHDTLLAILDWIAPATNPSFLEYYSKVKPSYTVPHRPMASVSELRLVKGITPEIYRNLLPYITALPETTKINVNDAEIPVLMSLSSRMTKASAQTIIAKRPFRDLNAFLAFDVVKNNSVDAELVTVSSQYFLLKTEVKIEKQIIRINTLLKRIVKNNKPIEKVLWQTKGTL